MKNIKLQNYIATLATLVISCSSCTSDKTYHLPTFPVEKEITGHCLNNDLLISYAYDMAVDDEYIYILALSEDKWIQVYHRESGAYTGGYIARGEGPGEINTGIAFMLRPDKHTLSVYDPTLMKAVTYTLQQAGADKPLLTFSEEESFASCKGAVRRAWPAPDGFLTDGQLGEPDNRQKRFQLYADGKVLSAYNDFPVTSKEQQAAFLSPQVCFSPSRTKMAAGTLYGGILETFALSPKNISHTGTHRFHEPDITLPSGDITPSPNMKYGFSALCADEAHIYAIWIGDTDPNRLDHISVFGWDGQGIAHYHTDKLIFKIACTDDKPENLYALTFDPGNGFSLYTYTMP